MKLTGNIIDLHKRRIFHGSLTFLNGVITDISEISGVSQNYILPGFVDAHVHIESSMLVPSEFARLAVVHGSVASVSDPHEIANVLGVEGVRYMMENGNQVPFKFFFGAPSCVPATGFETAGATIDAEGVGALLRDPDVVYLSEMMNYPGVLFEDQEVLRKIALAKQCGKPVDGHAPGVTGADAKKYFAAGISTDHECFTYKEACEKASLGVHILIREGSAAKNFNALIPLLEEYPGQVMFCSDDKHPDDLISGHINELVARALRMGCELCDILTAACLNPVRHYNLPVGTLRIGDPADFIVTDDLENFTIKQTWIDGKKVAEEGNSLVKPVKCRIINHFNATRKEPADFEVPVTGKSIHVIKALDGQLVTESMIKVPKVKKGYVVSDEAKDILKFTVVNRYNDAPPSMAFINGFNLKNGAIASCVGHDSHNILAVGTSDELLAKAVNLIIEHKGGIASVSGKGDFLVLPLPVAGIMTTEDGYTVALKYAEIDRFAKEQLGSTLTAPFMTLSFMALLVIPSLKLSDRGLFDGKKFSFTNLFAT